MRRIVGSISLLVLLLNTLGTPLAYAEEYSAEVVVESNNDIQTDDAVGQEEGDEQSPQFPVNENSDNENEEKKLENTGNIVEEGTGEVSEIVGGEVEALTGEIVEGVTGTIVEDLTGFAGELTGEISEGIGTGGESVIEEINYNKEPILGEKTYNDVTVNVEALTGIFPEGTELRITPIKWWNLSNLKDKLIEEQEEVNEDTTVVAFDITFVYSGEEVQPKDGEKVKVAFDYSNNEDLVEADKNENQEIRVYHIEDKDEEGNKLVKGEEKIEEIEINGIESKELNNGLVIDVEKFSIYVLALSNDDTIRLTLDPRMGGSILDVDNITVDDAGIGTIDAIDGYVILPGATKENSNFMGWYDGNNERKGGSGDSYPVLSSTTLYAKWEDILDTSSGYFPEVFSQKGACIFNGKNGTITGAECTKYYGNKFINTEIQLYETENHSKDYEIGFKIDHYLPNEQDAGIAQQTFMNTKREESGYPGLVFRRSDKVVTIASRRTSDKNSEWKSNNLNVETVKIYRIFNNDTNKKEIYYSIDGSDKILLNDLSQYDPIFDLDVWFGAAPTDGTATVAQRFLNATLSNMYIKLGTYMSKVTWNYRDEDGNLINEITDVGFNGTGILNHEIPDYETSEESCNFEGWKKGGQVVDISTFKIQNDVTFEASYSCNVSKEYKITYDLDGGFMKLTTDGVEENPSIYTKVSPTFMVNNPVKLNAIFIGWTGTDLSEKTMSLIIPYGSTGDREYIALYECEQGYSLNENGECVGIRNADGTLNFNVRNHGTVDFEVGESKITLLDRNLGASTDDINNTGSYGFYYKGGNNFGFSPNHTSKYGSTRVKVADVSGYGPGTASGYYLSHDWIYSTSEDNWFNGQNDNLWGDVTNTQVARQGPCPNLYHVPFNEEINGVLGMIDAYSNTQSGIQCIVTYGNKRLCFQNIMRIPTAGFLLNTSSDSSQRDSMTRAFLWMSSRSKSNSSKFSVFHSTNVNPTDGNANMMIGDRFSIFAMPVRCFKNTDVVTVSYELNGGTAKKGNIPDNLPSKTGFWYELDLGKGIKNPIDYTMTRDNSSFSGWYLDSEFTKPFTGGTILPYATQDTTFYAKFDCNEGYMESEDGMSCIGGNPFVTFNKNNEYGTVSTGSLEVEYGTAIATSGDELVIGGETVRATPNQSDAEYEYYFNGWGSTCGSGVNPAKYDEIIYKHDGAYKFDGTNYIKTETSLFSEDNYKRDFEISFNIVNFDYSTEEQGSFVNALLEDQGRGYPGFVFRRQSSQGNSNRYEYESNNHKYNLYDTISNNINVKIKRENSRINVKFGNKEGTDSYDYGSFNQFFDVPVTIGASLTGDGTPFRYIKGTLSGIELKYINTGVTNGELITGDCTITANFSRVKKSYPVIFKNEDGTVLDEKTVEYGITPEYTGAIPTKSSDGSYKYIFTGWTPEITRVEGPQVYTATFNQGLLTYTVTFNAVSNGGTTLTGSIEVASGVRVELDKYTATPTDSSYQFIGWSENPNSSVILQTDPIITSDRTLYAVFGKEVSATFNANGNKLNNQNDNITKSCIVYNKENQCNIITPTISNPITRTVVGYTTSSAGSTESNTGSNKKIAIVGGEVYYAQTMTPEMVLTGAVNGNNSELSSYDQVSCTLTGVYNGETQATSCEVDMPTITPHTNTQTVVGWNTTADSITNNSSFNSNTNKLRLTVENTKQIWYAITTAPEVHLSITYQIGTGVDSIGENSSGCIIESTYNGNPQATTCTVKAPTITVKLGYSEENKRWKKVGGDEVKLSGETITLNKGENSVTYEASTNIISYTIEYLLNSGTVTEENPASYTVESVDITLNNPTREGYIFEGWSGTNLTEPTETVIITQGSIGDRGYEANWEPSKYQVTYKANGGEGDDVEEEAIYDEHYEFLSNSFIRTGYTFVEWNTKADGSGSGFVEGFSGVWKTTTGVNLYAIWSENNYYVEYTGGEGAIGSKVGFTTTYTNTFALADNEGSFIMTGYTFSGWTYDGKHYAAGDELSRLASENGATVTFTAEWNKDTYTISYEYNDGTGSNPEIYQVDTPSFTLNNPIRTGYTFIGWSGTELEGSDNTSVNIIIGSVGDREYEANWEANKYNVTYKANGGVGADVVEEATYDSRYVFTGNNFTRTGYRFLEWNTKSDGTGTGYAEGFSGIWKTATGVNLFAQWIAETYTVTFDGNEGEVTGITDKDVIFDSAYGDLSTASRTGYTFTGWYTEAVVGEKVESETRVAIASDHTLYAHWNENSYNVVYEGGEGTEGIVTGATYKYTENFNLAANNFTKKGYVFSGWTYDGKHYAAGTLLSGLATEDGSTVTFIAEWNVVPYSIHYELDGGIFSGVVNPTTYTVNSATINVGNPERVGYIFLGWTGTDLSALSSNVVITGGSIGDRTYYANWQAREDIKITINHYLQDLDVDNNTVLDTYSISGTVKEEGTADSTINVSDYKQTIEGYSFDSGKVDGSVVSTTTVSPDGSRVIDLFYTRNSYSYAITTSVGSSTEGSSSNGNYYYGAKIILSGDSNNDCFVWSGWSVQGATLENNMKQTSFIIPANDVTANSLVREKTYNIVFNGNGEDSGTMSPLNGIRCTQEFTLPENSFVKTGYTFTGWTTIPNGVKEFDNKATIQTLTTGDNVTIEFIAIWDVNYYPIVWKDYDGDVLYEDEFPYMENPEYHGETPSRDADAQYTYSFAGWTPGVHIVTGAQVYTAVYNETLNEYTVTWDVNGTKTMETYKYGETPNFTGSKHKDPDEQYEYSFVGWTPEISSVTGDITYTATYTATLRKFTVTWNNRNGQTLEVDTGVEYGSDPSYNGETPTKPADAGHTYTFNGWIPELTGVTKDTTYVAKFSSDDNKYTITWLDEDDTILEIDTDVPYGTIPSYGKGTPVKTGDAQYSYTFSGWSPKVIPVEGDATYVATYTSEVNTYTITWKNSNGETLRVDTGVSYGTTGDFGGIPTSGSTDEFDYEFIGWNPAVGAIHGDTTYTAVYKSNKRKYSVRFVNGETELQSGMVEYGVMPVYIGSTPVKTGDAQYSYNYIGWTPGISAVTGDITYEATFEEIVNMYNVIFVDDDGSSVIQPAQKYAYGTLRGNIAKPVNPDKPDNEQYTYEFAGWIPVVSKITGDVTFTATYSGTLRTYSVTWKNWNGDVLETDANVPYGETPSYDSAEPTKPATAQYRYVFAGWDPVVSPVHGTITYTAQFDEVPMTYTITWKNGNTVLEVDTGVVYGSIPSYDGITPTKASDPQYDYVFAGWNPSTGEVVSDQVYVADFNPIIRTYTVLWKNHDGTTLETDENVPYGSTPSYNGSTPVKTGNAQYSYTFEDWSPDIGPIHGNTEYTAIYNETINKYVVAWDNYDGTELISDEVEYGVLPQYTGPTPTRERTDKYSYTFSNSWFPTVTSVTTGATYTAQFTSTVNEYTITWKDGDGNTLKTEQVAYDETPEYTGATPTKTATAQYTYSFNNTWSPEVQSVTGDMTYTAQFDSTVNKYTITWIDGDDQVLKTDQVAYGETPEYTGETPTKTPTQEHTYTFKGWSPAVTSVTGPATYKAVFDGDVNEYAITWLDGDGNILKMETLEYGQMPSYSGSIPTKTADAQYTYTFNGSWSPAIVSVTTGATYTAQFSSTLNKYSIVWKDGDGNTLKTDQVAYGTTPVYAGATPTKTATAQYSYTFNNTWSPAIVSVTTGATYTAQFSSTVNKYSIVWKDGDGNTLKTDQVAYGSTPKYSGVTPTKTATAQYSYTFNDTWSPEIEDVTTGATYTAQFTPVLNKYTIVWKDWNGTILKPAEELEYGTHPIYGAGDPVREGDAHYSYTFNGWNPAVQDVIGPQVYTATYLQTVNKYRITFLNDDDSEITSKQVEYGTTVANYKPDDPTKEGYTFNGWNPNLVNVVTGATYKATYTINQYTLIPELGVGLERIEGGGTFDYGTEVIFTGYAKEGYHFEGGETVKAFTVTVGAHNATVRINAIANKYVVKFQPNEGGGTMQDQEFTYDLTGVLHANSFRRSGYTFTGWIDEFGNYYADQGKVYNLVTGGVVEFTALWKVGEDKPEPVEPTTAAGGGRKIVNEDKEQEHESADTQTGGTGDIDSGSQYETGDIIPGDGSWTQEEMDAYKYAYKYHITTLAPREAAMPDDYVIRGHMAKMVVNYAVNVLGWKLPEKLPKQCKWNDGVDAWESQEIKDYAEKACALGLMGIDMNYFQPNKYVTRAQFGTIFGRLLRGKLPSTPYYAAHLAGLKERGIMTQIDHPEDRIEIRKWAWLMFMRSEKYFNIKK